MDADTRLQPKVRVRLSKVRAAGSAQLGARHSLSSLSGAKWVLEPGWAMSAGSAFSGFHRVEKKASMPGESVPGLS